jgi:phosphoglycolate phosphatase
MARTLVLDLDGTLVDSAPDLAASLNRIMARRGLLPVTEAETKTMVGDGVAMLLKRAFAARGVVPDGAALEEFALDYTANAAVLTRPFPGAAAALESLAGQGWRFAVCTNKPEAPARALLAALGLADFFAAIGGGDSFPVRKPDPAHLLATLEAAGGSPQEAVMAGDHANDVKAAHSAGLPCIFAAWGYGPAEIANSADAVASGFPEIPAIANNLVGRGG